MKPWELLQVYDEYYDYTKELLSIPDEGNTTVDMRLTFNAETRTCYYNIMLHNDDGNIRDWKKDHYVPWAVGIAMLGGEVEIPEELL
jgi:hypothetical protein